MLDGTEIYLVRTHTRMEDGYKVATSVRTWDIELALMCTRDVRHGCAQQWRGGFWSWCDRPNFNGSSGRSPVLITSFRRGDDGGHGALKVSGLFYVNGKGSVEGSARRVGSETLSEGSSSAPLSGTPNV